jgi:hypothetical protein
MQQSSPQCSAGHLTDSNPRLHAFTSERPSLHGRCTEYGTGRKVLFHTQRFPRPHLFPRGRLSPIMLGLLFWLALPFVIGLTCLPAPGNAASSAYVETTQGLNLNRVQLVILVPPEFTSRLSERATTIFAKAGFPLSDSNGPNRQFIATLTLSLNPQPLSDTCPGQVLYVPSLKLTEPVMIPRNSVIMHDVTWLAHTGAQVREPVTVAELERDLDAFIHQFIPQTPTAFQRIHRPAIQPRFLSRLCKTTPIPMPD